MLLEGNTEFGTIMLAPIMFQCVGVWFSTGLPLHLN